jgi:hypothetical protein
MSMFCSATTPKLKLPLGVCSPVPRSACRSEGRSTIPRDHRVPRHPSQPGGRHEVLRPRPGHDGPHLAARRRSAGRRNNDAGRGVRVGQIVSAAGRACSRAGPGNVADSGLRGLAGRGHGSGNRSAGGIGASDSRSGVHSQHVGSENSPPRAAAKPSACGTWRIRPTRNLSVSRSPNAPILDTP